MILTIRLSICFIASFLLSYAVAGSLCTPPPQDNTCVRGVGQFEGSACLTLQAFQTLSDTYLQSRATDFAAMSRFVEDPKQWVGIHNSCCTGLMQINYLNLRNPTICGCEAREFATYTQQQQIDVYMIYFHAFDSNYGMNELKEIINNHQTLGGYTVDGYTLVACAQMGAGNCNAAVQNQCRSVAVGEGGDNHVNVCTMADRAREEAAADSDEFASCGPN